MNQDTENHKLLFLWVNGGRQNCSICKEIAYSKILKKSELDRECLWKYTTISH